MIKIKVHHEEVHCKIKSTVIEYLRKIKIMLFKKIINYLFGLNLN